MFKIKAPVEGYFGYGYGLTFVNGEAQTDNAQLAERLKGLGYIVTKAGKNSDKDSPAPENDQNGEKERKAELREEMKKLGLKPNNFMTIEAMEAAITEAKV